MGRFCASSMQGVSTMKIIKSTLFFFFLLIFINNQTAIFAGGSKERQEEKNSLSRTLISTEPSEKPEWVDIVPKNENEFFFVGTSQIFDTPANARDNARENARVQVLEYYGQVIERQAVSLSSISGSTRDTLSAYVISEDEIKTFSQNVVSEVGTVAYYTEKYLNINNREEYIIYTLHRIDRQKAESEISNFAKNISERYTASLPQYNTLKTALDAYAYIIKSLEQNPLHRIMAYIETSKGRAALYEYSRIKINELAASVSIEAIDARTIQETESITTGINIRSALFSATGLLDCHARLFDLNGGNTFTFPFKSASEDPFNLQIRNVKPGSYNVIIEILLSDLTNGIAKNSSGSFSLTVTPLNILLESPAAIEAGIKRAVDTLAAGLQTQTETVIGHFTMTGTNIPSEFSIYLTEKAVHYAKNNKERKYRIIENNTEKAVILSGFFTKRNNSVDVTFELSTPNKERDGSYIFSISTDVLEKTIGLAIEPENIKKMPVLDDFTPPANAQAIHIEAEFDSSTRTYKHRDELKLTVSADKDCYFKIIHIDANNQIKMIFPVKGENNFLRANVSRNVFNSSNSRYMFYGPYGAETLVVVASPVQFSGIEKEYNQPWKTATEEAIKAAISGAGQARYPITIIKPHDEYEYEKPDNLMEFYQSIRDDASKQGGSFEGNTISGYYIINNIRGSYRVTNNNIQFAVYYLDAYTSDSYRMEKTRGAGFNFSLEKPQNIAQAVQTVRDSILGKGGIFTGNEQEGKFQASGITGQYQVLDVVNVNITEKPFVIPKSLIENEVKNFFGIR